MKRVLVIDSDSKVPEVLRKALESEGFSLFSSLDGELALETFDDIKPDAIILDIILPGMDGFDVCREVRKKYDTPIIILSSRSDVLDRIIGLELGADDYVQKPFEPKEIVARLKAILRRCDSCQDKSSINKDSIKGAEVIEFPGLKIDKARYVVTAQDKKVDMPPKELELLFFLATHPNRVFTRENLLGNVWGYDFFGESRTVDVHVKRIREKLDPISEKHNWKIKTVWGVGYKFEITE